ncbi:MAG TPA: hypothetical protein VES42_25920 [Pilimelia sp.]|nr:hypothetical protein [Pilimelia sp.]
MRGELDDALERLRRREEVRRRLDRDARPATPPAQTWPSHDRHPDRRPEQPADQHPDRHLDQWPDQHLDQRQEQNRERRAEHRRPDDPPTAGGRGDGGPAGADPADELLLALGDVVARYEGMAVTATVEVGGAAWTMRVSRRADGQVEVTAWEAPPADAGGAAAEDPNGAEERTAARLADLIRQDPTFLDT